MNETIKTILSRRSVRAYQQEQIKEEELMTILEAGRFSPSGMNRQSWLFTVVQSKEMLKKINEACRNSLLKSGNPAMEERARRSDFSAFYNAPTLIIVSGDKNLMTAQYDCTLALGYMFLAAASLNIGSCWVHGITVMLNSEDGKELKKELGIPEEYQVYSSGAFGYKATEPTCPPKKQLDEIMKIIK
ncbi:nitroreductase family protein [bacterium]|nr:nitroreductase family protein [bacterium]